MILKNYLIFDHDIMFIFHDNPSYNNALISTLTILTILLVIVNHDKLFNKH
jgi:hypothetical protein